MQPRTITAARALIMVMVLDRTIPLTVRVLMDLATGLDHTDRVTLGLRRETRLLTAYSDTGLTIHGVELFWAMTAIGIPARE